MKYQQRDIVEVNFMFPDGSFKPHPALIVSNNELQEDEGFIYLCMISSKAYNPQYNYPLTAEMLVTPMEKQSYVKYFQLQRPPDILLEHLAVCLREIRLRRVLTHVPQFLKKLELTLSSSTRA